MITKQAKVKDGDKIRVFDPMEVFSFSDYYSKVLCDNRIKSVKWVVTKEEAGLFERVANRARGVRSEV